MRYQALTMLLMLLVPMEGSAWRSFNRFHLGAEASGAGGAYVGDAANETAMFYNPAGLVQQKAGLSAHWEAATGVRVQDIFGSIQVRLDRFDSFSFFGFSGGLNQLKLGASLSTEFNASINNTKDLNMRVGAFSAAYPILSNLSVGFGIGPVFGTEQTGWTVSWAWNAGILYKPFDALQLGACFHSGYDVNWIAPEELVSLSESYPALFEAGGVWKMADQVLFCFGADWLNIDSIRYVVDGTNASPVFDGSVFTRFHPHIGFRFLEPITGAHLSAGFMTDSALYDGGSVPQFLLTAGFRFYGNNVVFSGSLIDAVLIGLFYNENERDERINVAFSYRFM